MEPVDQSTSAGPRIIFLADSIQHGATATTARSGDFLGVVGTGDTFVRGNGAWHPVQAYEVQRSFDSTGSIGVHKVPKPPPPYTAAAPDGPNAALASGKATL